MSLRRSLSALAFALILIGGFETYYLRIYVQDRTALREALTVMPWRRLPGFRPFLISIREATREGDTVGLWIPPMRWLEGYEYGFVRAGYLLGGRDVLPLLTPDNRIISANIAAADWIACYRCAAAPSSFDVVRAGPDGMLLRKR